MAERKEMMREWIMEVDSWGQRKRWGMIKRRIVNQIKVENNKCDNKGEKEREIERGENNE